MKDQIKTKKVVKMELISLKAVARLSINAGRSEQRGEGFYVVIYSLTRP